MKNTISRNVLSETIKKIDGAYAPSTIRAYKSNFENFINFCEKMNVSAFPADETQVVEYIKKLTTENLKSASIRLAVVAIATIHKLNQFEDPTQHPDVKLELRRMHRNLGRESQQAYGVNSNLLEKMINVTDNSLRGLRDRTIILLAYDSLCRRSELVSLQVQDIISHGNESEKTLKLKLRRSKTDQEATGRWLYLSKETQHALNEWLTVTGIQAGKILRGIRKNGALTDSLDCSHINRIYKRLATTAKLDSSIIQKISGHSMRVGAAQDLLLSGASMPMIMNRGRWSKTDTVMRYIESAGLSTF